MVKLRESMDSCSLDIVIDGKTVGFFQWHNNQPRIVLINPFSAVAVADLKTIIDLGENFMRRIITS